MFLMCANVKVMDLDTEDGGYVVFNEQLLPYGLKGAIMPMPDYSSIQMPLDISSIQMVTKVQINNFWAVNNFLDRRVLSLSRANAKRILNKLRLQPSDDLENRWKAATSCNGVSVSDNYWVSSDGNDDWSKVNIRNVPLDPIVAEAALHGTGLLRPDKKINTPELTTHGTYAKCWKRESGDLWLYKRGDGDSDYESHVEVCISKLLDKTNLRHVEYEDAESMGKYCCKCRCMADDSKSILSGLEFYLYCKRNRLNPRVQAHKLDPEMMYGMHIFDYLVSNDDRHLGNWGFYYDSQTTELLSCHPLFDHNRAFNEENMRTLDGGKCQFFSGKTMQQTAEYSMKKCNFHFTEKVKRSDFMNARQYKSFIARAKAIGMRVT